MATVSLLEARLLPSYPWESYTHLKRDEGETRAAQLKRMETADGGRARGENLEGVLEAPCYYPTVVEFEEPLKYIASIRPEAEQYGICRICPPPGWKPPFAHKPDKLRFSTKEQDLVSEST